MDITERQKEILKAIIKEFMEEAEEVGSLSLVQKYDLGVSPATIRSEMVKLMDLGLLEKSHISSGRLPTDQALRFYISNVLSKSTLSPLISIEIRQGIHRDRFDKDVVEKEILSILAKETESLVFLVTDKETRFYGISNLLKYPEFNDLEKLRIVFNILEDESFLRNLVCQYNNSGTTLLIGEETGIENMTDCAIAFIKVPFWESNCTYVGVWGTKRMDYSVVIPVLSEVRDALEQATSGWR